MVDVWLQIGGGAVLILVLGTLLKFVGDLGQIKGTVSTLVTRMDVMDADVRELRAEMSSRFHKIETEMNSRFLRIETELNSRFLRIENILMGRSPGAETPEAGD